METTIDTVTIAPSERIVKAYIDYLLNNGAAPPSVFKFCDELGISEEEFYNYFGSFEGLERAIWKGFIERTINKLNADEPFQTFSAREKLLTFYYAFFEELKQERSFALLQLKKHRSLELVPDFLKDFKAVYISFVDIIINTGKANGEIARRPLIDKKYPSALWFHMAFLLVFWKDDNSAGFESTDAAIEKSVGLAFEFIGKGAVDSVIDFAKFLYQARFR
ncbi:MAG: TetR family transcriptional regulator C-terminal domain-containing protein [Flavitalea sp.]